MSEATIAAALSAAAGAGLSNVVKPKMRTEAALNGQSEYKQLQHRFWIAFKEFLEKNSQIRSQTPFPQHWTSHAIGFSGAWLSSVISMWDMETGKNNPEMRVEFVLDGDRLSATL